jgi:hypothetical protein
MDAPGARTRTRITVPRVDFDLLAPALGYAAEYDVRLNATTSGQVPGFEVLRRAFFEQLIALVRVPYLDRLLVEIGWAPVRLFEAGAADAPLVPFRVDVPWWHHVAVVLVLLVVWSVIGGALARVHAVRIARDRSISWDDGFAFAFSNLRAFVQAPLFVLLAVVLFGALVVAGGAVVAIPWAGAIIQAVLQPLTYVAGLIVTIIVLGGIFGFPMLQCAIATERNGTLDAVSRTYSYAFTRPVLYVAGGALVFAVAGLIASLGSWFLEGVTMRGLLLGASWSEETVKAVGAGYAAARSFGVPNAPDGLTTPGHISLWVSYVWSALAVLAVRGFVLSYVVGGLTDLYFLLREEVDGTPTSEIYLEDAPELELGEPLEGEPRSSSDDA